MILNNRVDKRERKTGFEAPERVIDTRTSKSWIFLEE